MINPDLEVDSTYPPKVEDFRRKIFRADSCIFASPDYNYSITLLRELNSPVRSCSSGSTSVSHKTQVVYQDPKLTKIGSSRTRFNSGWFIRFDTHSSDSQELDSNHNILAEKARVHRWLPRLVFSVLGRVRNVLAQRRLAFIAGCRGLRFSVLSRLFWRSLWRFAIGIQWLSLSCNS
ncbi:hypothetical protein K1719_028129 [Acacia pycnantha]|nr:hypothetical protein K1719_028129 [Acacia pycnantha]